MNKKIYIILGVSLLLGFINDASAEEKIYEEIPYTDQTKLNCNGQEIKIPHFSPRSKNNLFLKLPVHGCNKEYFDIAISIGKDCNGAHACEQYSFSRDQIIVGVSGGKMVAEDKDTPTLGSAIAWGFKPIKLSRDIIAYIVPSQVYAYPTPTQIVWDDGSYVYSIKAISNEDELVEAANSLINSE